MKVKWTMIAFMALALTIGGAAAFADSGLGRTPSVGASWDNALANDVTGVSGAVSTSSMSGDQAAGAIKSSDVDVMLSPQELVNLASAWRQEPKFGTNGSLSYSDSSQITNFE